MKNFELALGILGLKRLNWVVGVSLREKCVCVWHRSVKLSTLVSR